MEKIIHQIWIGPYEMPDREKYFVSQVKEKNPDFEHILWTNDNLPELPPKIKEKYQYHYDQEVYAFAADVLRIFLIREYGGIYIDVDWNCHKGFSDLNLENYNGLIIYHNEYTTGNECFGSKKGGYIEFMYQNILLTSISDTHTPYWFNSELKKYYNIVDTCDRYLFSPEEFEQIGLDWLNAMKNDKVLALRKWGEFEKVYLTHYGLYSWESKHMKYFKDGNINYQDVYNVEGYNLVIENEDTTQIIVDNIKLLRAVYGKADVKKIIADNYIKNNSINIPVNNNTFGDTWPGMIKELVIEFEYNNVYHKHIIGENNTFIFP